jgi:ABC-type antimicrobial peptide transport system permease subunit
VTCSQVDAWLRNFSERLLRQGDQAEAQIEGWSMFAIPFLEYNNAGLRIQLTVVSVALMFVLFIACLNIAGLMLARTSRQHGEYAVRLALGASYTDLLKLCLSESTILCVAGGLLGLMGSTWGLIFFWPRGQQRLLRACP